MYWISWFLLLTLKHVSVTGNETTTTDTLAPETTIPTTTEIEEEDAEKEKSQGDLDLETQDQVAILKQINRVNDDGSYTFGYEAADGSFKIETRDVNGNVKGMFGFINEDGELKRVSYSASNGTGFQSTGTLNIPPLPGTTLSSDEKSNQPFGSNRYEQLIQLKQKSGEDSSTKISLLDSTTSTYENTPDIPSPRLPIYIFGSSTPASKVTSSSRPVVIQHIPKVRPTPASSSTIPTESEEILLKPLLSDLAPKRTSNTNFISFGTNDVTPSAPDSTTTTTTTTEENTGNPSVIQVIRPRTGPFKKVIVTKRPVVATTPKVVTTTEYKSKDYLEKLKNKESTTEAGNEVRRQLGITNNYATPTSSNLVTSGTEDNPDVYGGRHASRPYPTNAYRALFSQVPQHQRILQNSYIQNRNHYLAAALGNPSITSTTPPQLIPSTTPNPNQIKTYTGAPSVPQDSNILSGQSNFLSTPIPQAVPQPLPQPAPQPVPDIQSQRQFDVLPNYGRQYPPTGIPIGPPHQLQSLSNQIYIPPALIEHLIRMLLAAQQRLINQRQQTISPFQQAVIATLGPGNIPPELLSNRYDPRYYQPQVPYPNFSQVPSSYPDPMPSRGPYDSQYSVPYYQTFVPYDPRYSYQTQMFTPVPFARFPPQTHPYEVDPARQQNDDLVLRMLLGYPRFPPQGPVQPTSNVVERSPPYQPGRDSTTSSTTPSSRVGPVRNVEILGQINEDSSTSSSYESSTKSGE